jgi:hypothetical protein
MERTHNHPSPTPTRNRYPPAPLSTRAILPYQGEENVNARAGICL